jgi:hypothetical protein
MARDPAGNVQMPWQAAAFFCAYSEVGGPWLSEMRAGSQSRDHPSLVLKTRREAGPASFGPRLWFLTAERKEVTRTVATAYVLLRLGKGGHCIRCWHRRVAHDAKAKENTSNRSCKPQFNSTESG